MMQRQSVLPGITFTCENYIHDVATEPIQVKFRHLSTMLLKLDEVY